MATTPTNKPSLSFEAVLGLFDVSELLTRAEILAEASENHNRAFEVAFADFLQRARSLESCSPSFLAYVQDARTHATAWRLARLEGKDETEHRNHTRTDLANARACLRLWLHMGR